MARYNIQPKKLKALKRDLKLTQIQKAVIVGSVLGDGYLQQSKNGQSARLQIRNTTKQKQYVLWKYNYLKNLVVSPPRYDKYNNSWLFETMFHPELLPYHKLFYSGRKKIIPRNIAEIFREPLTLAVWIMDDGNGYKNYKALRISSYCFTEIGHWLLQECLRDNFGVSISIYREPKGNVIYIPAISAQKLFLLVSSYIHPVMQYKFARLNPVETTRWPQ